MPHVSTRAGTWGVLREHCSISKAGGAAWWVTSQQRATRAGKQPHSSSLLSWSKPGRTGTAIAFQRQLPSMGGRNRPGLPVFLSYLVDCQGHPVQPSLAPTILS